MLNENVAPNGVGCFGERSLPFSLAAMAFAFVSRHLGSLIECSQR